MPSKHKKFHLFRPSTWSGRARQRGSVSTPTKLRSTVSHSAPSGHHAPVVSGHQAPNASGHEHRRLSELVAGDSATIHAITGTREVRLHLMEMGITPGTHVRVCRIAVMGGPLDISIRGYRLSLRQQEAAAIELRSVHAA